MRNKKHLLFAVWGFAGGGFGALLAEIVPQISGTGAAVKLIIHAALWSAAFASILTLGLFWAGETYNRRPGFPARLFRKAITSGALVGAIAGALAQAVYTFQLDSAVVREFVFKPFCWSLMGVMLGWRLSLVIPNLGLGRGVIGGALGGFVGGLGFVLSGIILPEIIGRMLGVGILGACLGLAIVAIEAIFRQASLEIIWAPKETTSVTLGTNPVYIGGGDDHIYVSGLPQHIAKVVLDHGKIQYVDIPSGKQTELKNGSQIKIGQITVRVNAKRWRTQTWMWNSILNPACEKWTFKKSILLVSERWKPAKGERMKTRYFEGRIALPVVPLAQGRDESTQREPATFDNDLGGAWLVAPAHGAGAGDPPRDGRKASALSHSALRRGALIGAKSGHSAPRVFVGRPAKFMLIKLTNVQGRIVARFLT
jgi:hypothetical protein